MAIGERRVLPGIDVHAALDSHTWGCMYVRVRNDGKPDSADSFVFAGPETCVYAMENLPLSGPRRKRRHVYPWSASPFGIARPDEPAHGHRPQCLRHGRQRCEACHSGCTRSG